MTEEWEQFTKILNEKINLADLLIVLKSYELKHSIEQIGILIDFLKVDIPETVDATNIVDMPYKESKQLIYNIYYNKCIDNLRMASVLLIFGKSPDTDKSVGTNKLIDIVRYSLIYVVQELIDSGYTTIPVFRHSESSSNRITKILVRLYNTCFIVAFSTMINAVVMKYENIPVVRSLNECETVFRNFKSKFTEVTEFLPKIMTAKFIEILDHNIKYIASDEGKTWISKNVWHDLNDYLVSKDVIEY